MADNNGNDYNNDEDEGYDNPEQQFAREEQASPQVAAPPARNIAFLGIFLVAIAVVVYLLFSGSSSKEEEKVAPPPPPPRALSTQNEPPPEIVIPEFNQLPPVNIPQISPENIENANADEEDPEEENEKLEKDTNYKKRIQSDLLIGGGIFGDNVLGGGQAQNPNAAGTVYGAANDNDPSLGFADSFYNQKNIPNAFARKLGDTSRLITQGKILEAILETPINTDVPGMIRALVSRDVYAESGRSILIPKGSRLVGSYNNFVIRGNKRVNIIWSRVIRPDGIDIMIRSGGADQLGRAGVPGDVDNKFLEIFSSAFLVSALNIAAAVGVEEISGDTIQQTNNPDGTQTQTTTLSQQAGLQAIDLFGNAAENLIQNYVNTKPTISIDQGTRISVFVNRDLIFPSGLSSQINFIQ